MTIKPPPQTYTVTIGESLVDEALSYAARLSSKTIVITTGCVLEFLPKIKAEKIVIRPSEQIKTRAMKEKIEDALIERGWGRETCVVAIGGGVLLDLVGFVCGTYCRGIPFVSIPTTLLAMTDAAIGGKTAVNVEEAKNWIGTFHHPAKIFLDLKFLDSLPKREFVYGLAETIKHSLIADADLFAFLERHLEEILAFNRPLMQEMIRWSCSLKMEVVQRDPYETEGYRRILNFGHTIGHALETVSNYALPHGQAVAMGMLIEAHAARRMGYLSHVALERIVALINRVPFHLHFPDRPPYEVLKRDKKGAHRLVVLTGIGSVAPIDGEYATSFSEEIFQAAWNDAVCHD